MSAGFQANMSRLFLSTLQSSIFPFSDRLPPIVTVCLGYSGCIATFILSATASSLGGSSLWAFATILHSASIMVLLRSVTIHPSTGNLSIPWAVDGTAWTFLRPERLMIPLYGNGDRATIKFLKEFVECFSSPKDTISDIIPNGQDISPLNPRSGVVTGIIRIFTFGRSLLNDVDEVSNLGMKSIEDEEVSLVDGVLEGALGELEMEALVDAMDVDNG
ncbi:hypothetical protein Tco_0967979 [Tanacetum coccineum]